MTIVKMTIDFQKNNFTALSAGDGHRPILSLLPCEMNFLKVYSCVLKGYHTGNASPLLKT
ncbi:MAG: hypothetical protein WA151_15665, partial [Desulfatirhabdiaceae bacterium]